MFKRVEKRLKRKEREDELGLDEDMKDVLGLNATDSDESESDVDSENESVEGNFLGMEDDEDDEADVQFDGGGEEFDDAVDDEDQEEGKDKAERALITVAEALNDPVFIVSLDPDIKECIVCPGKLLKGTMMVETHKSSNAHERRFKLFQELAESTSPIASAQGLVERAIDEKGSQSTAPSGASKRAEKKRISREKRKIKREKFKARQKAKKEKVANASSNPEESVSKDAVKVVEKAKVEKEAKEVTGKQKRIEKSKKKPTSSPDKSSSKPSESKKSKPRNSPDNAVESPKKKRKTSITSESTSPIVPKTKATATPPTFTDPKKKRGKFVMPTVSNPASASTVPKPSKPKSASELPADEESPAVIRKLQAEVKDIIKSAPSFAKAARARALSGDSDGDTKGKPSSLVKKRKSAHAKIKAHK